jgi:branched-chain amino acid aminotransferase
MDESKAEYVWMDGEYVPWSDASVHVTTHALHYGTGVFEGIRGYWNADRENVFLFRVADHVSRLFYSAKVYRMEIPHPREQVEKLCSEIVAKNAIRDTCYIRPIVYRGPGPFGLNPFKNPVNMFVYALPFGRYLGPDALESGVKVMFTSWERISPRALPPEVKACGQYINSVLAKMEAVENGFDEALFLDSRGFVSEGSGENVFGVKDGIVMTPPLTASILPGITRDTVVRLFSESGTPVREADITRSQLYGMDEVFMVGTAGEVTPITQIDRVKIGDGRCGPVTMEMQKAYFEVVMGDSDRHSDWLTAVY